MTLSVTKISAKKTKSVSKFLRLPIDSLTQNILQEVKAENPYFSELDSVRWILGKYYKNSKRVKLLNWLDENVAQKNLPRLSEGEIFEQAKNI